MGIIKDNLAGSAGGNTATFGPDFIDPRLDCAAHQRHSNWDVCPNFIAGDRDKRNFSHSGSTLMIVVNPLTINSGILMRFGKLRLGGRCVAMRLTLAPNERHVFGLKNGAQHGDQFFALSDAEFWESGEQLF